MDTRRRILEAAYQDMVVHGFQGTRPDKVIQTLGITKGALYHYFPSKLALGYAVVEEILEPQYLGNWDALNSYRGNPLDFVNQVLERIQAGVQGASECLSESASIRASKGVSESAGRRCGSPLSNLIQEMSPLDEGFRLRLRRIAETILEALAKALSRAQEAGQVKRCETPEAMARFIFSTLEGSYGLSKVFEHPVLFTDALSVLSRVLDGWKADGRSNPVKAANARKRKD